MSPKNLLRCLFVALVATVAASQAAVEPPKEGDDILIVTGCCWKKDGSTLYCGSPTLKKDCAADRTWVANKSCGQRECGG